MAILHGKQWLLCDNFKLVNIERGSKRQNGCALKYDMIMSLKVWETLLEKEEHVLISIHEFSFHHNVFKGLFR